MISTEEGIQIDVNDEQFVKAVCSSAEIPPQLREKKGDWASKATYKRFGHL
jgi:hypothetical protein